jgi:hypothetical protein
MNKWHVILYFGFASDDIELYIDAENQDYEQSFELARQNRDWYYHHASGMSYNMALVKAIRKRLM